MSEDRHCVLVIGYGNPGRLDDGLGPALASAVEKMNIAGVSVDSDYQLTVEDASQASEHDVVIFADASENGCEPFFFERILPDDEFSFSSHSVEPGSVLTLAGKLFGNVPRGYALGIRGYEYNEFGERLSPKALINLDEAIKFIEKLLRSGEFEKAVGN
jgi:hydrogenase maturation protease